MKPAQKQKESAPLSLLFVAPSQSFYQSVTESLRSAIAVPIISTPSFEQLGSWLKAPENRSGLIVCGVTTKESVKDLLYLLRDIKTELQDGSLRILVQSGFAMDRIQKFLKEYPIAEILPLSIEKKTLEHKIRHQLSLLGQIQNQKSTPIDLQKALQALPQDLKFGNPLEHPADCWIIEDPRHVRKVMGNWIIECIGPGRAVGKWVAQKTGDTRISDELVWRFTPFSAVLERFVPESLAWVFYGREPKFQNQRWTFVGRAPKLVLFSAEGPGRVRFAYNEAGDFVVAANSAQTLARMGEIRKTFEAEDFFDIRTPRADTQHDGPVFRIAREQVKEFEIQQSSVDAVAKLFALKGKRHRPQPRRFELLEQFRKNQHFEKSAKKRGAFRIVDNVKQIDSRLKESSDAHVPIILWTSRQTHKIECTVNEFSAIQKTLTVAGEAGDIANFLHQARKNGFSQLLSKFSIHRGAVFWASPLLSAQFDGKRLTIPMPVSLFEIQRRSYFRLPIYPNSDVEIELSAGEKRRLINLSAGGLAFECQPDERPIYKKDIVLGNVTFQLNNQDISVPARVAWSGRGKEAGLKGLSLVGVEFLNLKPDMAKKIEMFVFEEALGYFATYVPDGD